MLTSRVHVWAVLVMATLWASPAVADPGRTTRAGSHAGTARSSFARPLRGRVLTPGERALGLHLNRIETVLAGNSHFPGWWDVVPHDTSIVVAQGRAYQGRTR
jgi:hypothetical protein